MVLMRHVLFQDFHTYSTIKLCNAYKLCDIQMINLLFCFHSGVSTASAKHQNDVLTKNIINNNNSNVKGGNSDYVSIQSR